MKINWQSQFLLHVQLWEVIIAIIGNVAWTALIVWAFHICYSSPIGSILYNPFTNELHACLITLYLHYWIPVVNVLKLFMKKSRFPKNIEIEKSFFWCLNLPKNVKTLLFLSETLLQNYLLLLKCCFGLRGNLNFRDFLPKSCKTSTTGPSIIRPKFDAVDNGRNPSRHFFKIRRIGMLHWTSQEDERLRIHPFRKPWIGRKGDSGIG